MQTISSTAQGASITPLNKRWIGDPRNRTNDVLRRFNRDTEWLAAGILGAMVSAALVLAAQIQEGQPKAVDQAKEERQTGGNALVNANSQYALQSRGPERRKLYR